MSNFDTFVNFQYRRFLGHSIPVRCENHSSTFWEMTSKISTADQTLWYASKSSPEHWGFSCWCMSMVFPPCKEDWSKSKAWHRPQMSWHTRLLGSDCLFHLNKIPWWTAVLHIRLTICGLSDSVWIQDGNRIRRSTSWHRTWQRVPSCSGTALAGDNGTPATLARAFWGVLGLVGLIASRWTASFHFSALTKGL